MGLKFYRNADNHYEGAMEENLTPPEGWIEVASAPERASDIWNPSTELWEQVVFPEQWEPFCNALIGSSVGQRILAATPCNWVGCLTSALAAHNLTAIDASLAALVQIYSITSDEKNTINGLIDQYHVPLNHVT